MLWAEALSCQVEYKYLARLTGRAQYYEKVRSPIHDTNSAECPQVETIMDIMRDANITDGMFPTKWAMKNAIPVNGTRYTP